MIIFPAIDIKDKKVVRLVQGKFDQVTEYGDSPMQAAEHWKNEGAEWLHIVDLDGAKSGALTNLAAFRHIRKQTGLKVQLGGGIRDKNMISILLNDPKQFDRYEPIVDRVILGTSVAEDEPLAKEILSQWSDKVAVSLDCSNGFVAKRGWQEVTGIKGVDLAKRLASWNLKTLIYTDIARDGMLIGPNFEQVEGILQAVPNVSVIASGGISKIDDIIKLSELSKKYGGRLIGAITGKAIYEGKLDFKEAVKIT